MRDYIGLWLIALANDQLGFAFDVSLAAKQAFPDDERAGMLYLHTRNLTQTYLADQCRKPVSVARKIVPKALQPLAIRMRNFICGKRS